MSQPNSKRIPYFRPETESSSLIFTNSCALPTTVIVADVQRNLLNRPALAAQGNRIPYTRKWLRNDVLHSLSRLFMSAYRGAPFRLSSTCHIAIFRPGTTLIPKVFRTIITVAIFWTARARPVAMAPPTTPYVGISRAHATRAITAPR